MSEDNTSQNEVTEPAQSVPPVQAAEPIRAAEAEPATEQQLQEIKQEMSAFERSTLRWTRATCAVFAVTLIFIVLQWTAMRGQLDEMRQDAVIGQRAWVGIGQPIELESLSLEQNFPKANLMISLKNYGSSVALNIATDVMAVLRVEDIVASSHKTCEVAASWSDITIAPKDQLFQPERAYGDSLFPAQEQKMELRAIVEHPNPSSSNILYVIGCIVYRDQFGHQRQTRFIYGGVKPTVHLPVVLYPAVGFNDAK